MFRKKTLTSLAIAAAFLFPASFLNHENSQGQAWTWGFGRNGELGLGSQSNLSLPHSIKNRIFIDIDAKKSFSAGITSEGKLFTWGKNRNGVLGHVPPNLNLLLPRQVEFPDKIKQVSLGYQTMCVVTQKGEAFIWGLQQKKSGFRSIGTVEQQKKDGQLIISKVNLSNISMASCANQYTTFITKEGRVFSLGESKSKVKNQVVELPLENITKISSGINFTMALNDQGRVFVWGNNIYGQLGNGGLKNGNEPAIVEALIRQKIVDISAGDNFSGVVTENGDVYTWGFGNQGQLGHGDKSDQFLPRKITNLKEKVKGISCGGAHTALLTQKGNLLMVGRGREGQLGREQKDESNSGYTLAMREVEQLPQGSNILKVCCGANHTLILLKCLM